jgi:hypothetical protein
MRLSTALYPPGAWIREPTDGLFSKQDALHSEEDVEESWKLRRDLLNWGLRTITELKDDCKVSVILLSTALLI